jgi:hypothetical protein
MTNRDEGGSIGGLLYASRFQFVLYALQDIDFTDTTNYDAAEAPSSR